jgi:predicted DNA binding CopG/RHH family protein
MVKKEKKTGSYKNRTSQSSFEPLSPEAAIQFLDDFQKLQQNLDEPTKLISLRIPENILRQLKSRATIENRKYQSMIVEYIRKGLIG